MKFLKKLIHPYIDTKPLTRKQVWVPIIGWIIIWPCIVATVFVTLLQIYPTYPDEVRAAAVEVKAAANPTPDLDAGEVKWAQHIARKLDTIKKPDYTLFDKSRVDILLTKEAVEVDWAHKWTEAIGQSKHYSVHTDDRQPVVLLLIPDSSDVRKGRRAYTKADRAKEIGYYLKAIAAGQSQTPKVKVWVYDLRADAFVAGKPSLTPESW